jgi:imidazolonepropionase-like amidohydrolase
MHGTHVTKDPTVIKIYAGKLFDPYTLELLENRVITVSEDSGLIVDVQPFSDLDYCLDSINAKNVDLRELTVLPGFVDAHVHCMLELIRSKVVFSID